MTNMNTRQDIQDFIAQKTLAIVGMSRAPQSFSANAAKCILMFAEPVGAFHGLHRWLKGLFGGLPK